MIDWEREIKINHVDGDIFRLGDMLTSPYSILYKSFSTIEDILAYESDGVMNIERVFSMYSRDEYNMDWTDLEPQLNNIISQYKLGFREYPKYDLIKVGTPLVIPVGIINSGEQLSSVQVAKHREYSDFSQEYLDRVSSKKDLGNVIERPIVLVYSRTVGSSLIDITKNMVSLSATKSEFLSESISISVKDTDKHGSHVYTQKGVGFIQSKVRRGDIVFVKRQASSRDVNSLMGLKSPDGEVDMSVLRFIDFTYIGRISEVSPTKNPNSPIVSIQCNGIQSILDEDGTSYLSRAYISDRSSSDDASIDRSSGIARIKGRIVSEFQLLNSTIDIQIRFLLDYLSGMGAYDDLASAIPGARTKKTFVPGASRPTDLVGLVRVIDVKADKSVADRRILSRELGNMHSSISSEIMRCSPNFLSEIKAEHIGNMTNLIVRRPPFDRFGIMHYINNGAVAEISSSQVLSQSLVQEGRAYTWFRMEFNIFDPIKSSGLSWLIPSKVFTPLFDIYGDKPLQARNPYIDRTFKNDNESDRAGMLVLAEQIMMDMKYFVESNIYLPFTRSGTIVLNTHDDRIKDGSWIYNESTEDICYVKSVSDNLTVGGTISSSMTINVERCIPMRMLDKYFDFVRYPMSDDSTDIVKFVRGSISDWSIDTEIMKELVDLTGGGKGWRT